jgi:hypothetical protein
MRLKAEGEGEDSLEMLLLLRKCSWQRDIYRRGVTVNSRSPRSLHALTPYCTVFVTAWSSHLCTAVFNWHTASDRFLFVLMMFLRFE